MLKRQVETQSEQIADLEERVDKNDQTRKDLAKNTTQVKSDAEEEKEIARSASVKACQVKATHEENEATTWPTRHHSCPVATDPRAALLRELPPVQGQATLRR